MSLVTLRMEPSTAPMSWHSFTKRSLTRSIALDGYVSGPPRWQARDGREYANFNHHEMVDRYATRATCAQVLMAIRQGIFTDGFRNEDGDLDIRVYANDCDEDVCLSYFLLSHYDLVRNPVNPLINRLVHMEDLLDATAGAYVYPVDGNILHEMAWIFQPYHQIRLNGGLGRRDAGEFYSVVEDVGRRIMAHITGKGESLPLATDYVVLERHGNFAVIEERGAQCRTKVFADGITSFLAVKKRENGSYDYKLGKMSPYIKLNVPNAFTLLNEIENLVDNPDKWGGSDTIGGSPRVAGSRLQPCQVMEVVESCLAA